LREGIDQGSSWIVKEGVMPTKPFAIKWLGNFNILLGVLTAGMGLVFLALVSAVRWNWDSLVVACLPAAGVCHAIGGGQILSRGREEMMRGMRFLGLTVIFGLAFLVGVAWQVNLEIDSAIFLALCPGWVVMVSAAELVFFGVISRRLGNNDMRTVR
jgi:hypothetical protein